MGAIKESELAVIGACMQGAQVDLSPSDFQTPELRTAYDAIQRLRLANRPTDLINVNAETHDSITTVLCDALQYAIPSLAKSHAGIVRDNSVRRQVASLASELHRNMQDGSTDLTLCIESATQALKNLSIGGSTWLTSTELANSTIKWLEELSAGRIKPVSSGIADIDRLIGGFYPGELTIVGAKPGTGKTVFGMVLGLNAAKSQKRVGIMNLEMIDTQYGTRVISNLGNVDATQLRKGKITDWESITNAALELSQLPASFLFTSRYIEDLKNAVKDKNLDLLVVDYLQLVRTRQNLESERLRMAHISWTLKELAVDLRIPIVAMSQLRRPDAAASDKMPGMRDLRESGNLEADADGIIMLHEPANENDPYVYKDDKKSLELWKKKGLRYICMKIDKQRQGAVGTVPVLFDAAHMRYVGIER